MISKMGNWMLDSWTTRALELIGMYWLGVFLALTVVGILHGLHWVYWIAIPVSAFWLWIVWFLVFWGRHRDRDHVIDLINDLRDEIDGLKINRLDPGPRTG